MEPQHPPRKLRLKHDAPIRLSGTPDRLLGIVELANEEKTSVLLKGFDVVETALPHARYMPKRRLFAYRAMEAGSSAKVTVETALDDLTPPGEYAATVMVGDTARPAVLEVKARELITFHPTVLELRGAPDEVVTETLIFENQGNVPVTVGMLGLAVLTEVEQVCTSLQRALAATGKDDGGYETFLNTLANDLARKRVDAVRVRAAKALEIPAGDADSVAIEFHLPGNVAPGHHYRGKVLMFGQSLGLRLNVTAVAPKTAKGRK